MIQNWVGYILLISFLLNSLSNFDFFFLTLKYRRIFLNAIVASNDQSAAETLIVSFEGFIFIIESL